MFSVRADRSVWPKKCSKEGLKEQMKRADRSKILFSFSAHFFVLLFSVPLSLTHLSASWACPACQSCRAGRRRLWSSPRPCRGCGRGSAAPWAGPPGSLATSPPVFLWGVTCIRVGRCQLAEFKFNGWHMALAKEFPISSWYIKLNNQ